MTVAGVGIPTSFCGCREPGRFLTEECVAGCSLHSSGHVFSRASSDQREDNSHVPLVRLFRATQAWAILRSLQAHPTSQSRAPSTFQSGAERPHSAWGLTKLWCEWPWRYLLPWTPFPVSPERKQPGVGEGRAQAQDTHKACEISLWAETALKCQEGRVGSVSWEGRSGAWQRRRGDAFTRTPYGPSAAFASCPPKPGYALQHRPPSESAPEATLYVRYPINTHMYPGGWHNAPPFHTRENDARRQSLPPGSQIRIQPVCASVPSGSQMLSRLLHRQPPEPAGGSWHGRSDRQGMLLPNPGQIQSSTLAGEQTGSQQQWRGMAYSQAAEGYAKI